MTLGLAARYRMPQTMYLSSRLSLDETAARQWGEHYGADRGAARIPEFIRWMQANVELRHDCTYPFAAKKRFLLELGNGFSFVARQKRLLIEDDEFFADLVFYNRLLRCFVIVEIKTQKITHQDLGQLQMYVNYYDRYEKLPDENQTIGILLCASKNNEMVKLALPENNQTVLASQYKLYLPSESQLLKELKKELEDLQDE